MLSLESAVLMTEAMDMDNRLFAGNCLEPGKVLMAYLKENGQAGKAAPVESLLEKYHPTEY